VVMAHFEFVAVGGGDHESAIGTCGDPPDPATGILATRLVGSYEIAGLKPKMLSSPSAMGHGKAVSVRSAELALATPFGDPNLHIRGEVEKALGRTGANAQGIVIMLLREMLFGALFFGASARTAFEGQARGRQLMI